MLREAGAPMIELVLAIVLLTALGFGLIGVHIGRQERDR